MARRRKEARRAGTAHEACEALGAFLPCAATVVSPIAGWCLSRATPRGAAVEAHCDTTAGMQRAERTADGGGVDVPRAFLCRHVRRAFMRSAWLDVPPIIPATVCHQRNDVERYSRFKE